MAGVYANLAQIMASRDMSLSRTPFNPDIVVIKRASFPKGVVPDHLEKYLIKKGQCKGVMGKIIYKGRVVPKAAACTAARYGKGPLAKGA